MTPTPEPKQAGVKKPKPVYHWDEFQKWNDDSIAWSSRWIERAMKMAGVSQRELAKRMGVAHPTICRQLNGKRAVALGTLMRILSACGLEIEELRVRRKQ